MPTFRNTNTIPTNFFDRFVCFRKITTTGANRLRPKGPTKGARFQTRPNQRSAWLRDKWQFCPLFFEQNLRWANLVLSLFAPLTLSARYIYKVLAPNDEDQGGVRHWLLTFTDFRIVCVDCFFYSHLCARVDNIGDLELWFWMMLWEANFKLSFWFFFVIARVEGLLVWVKRKEERFYARFCWQWLMIVEKLVLQFAGCIWCSVYEGVKHD